jgi:hypothetical protein
MHYPSSLLITLFPHNSRGLMKYHGPSANRTRLRVLTDVYNVHRPGGGRVFLRWPEVAYYPRIFEHRLP